MTEEDRERKAETLFNILHHKFLFSGVKKLETAVNDRQKKLRFQHIQSSYLQLKTLKFNKSKGSLNR